MVALLGCLVCLAIASPGRGQTSATRDAGVPPARPADVPSASDDGADSTSSSDQGDGTFSAGGTPAPRGFGLPTRQDGGGLPTRSDPPGFFNELLVSLLLVLILGGVAFVVIKRVLPRLKWGRLIGQGRKVRLVESVAVGPRQQVHLLEVGGRSLLISASRDGVRMLADVTDAFHPGGQDGEAGTDTGGFAGILDKKLDTKQGGDA